ncbi:MAG TPA: ABC transporter permease subunit [Planctomycetes bacterium]|nr:ABC transporter permease subunit [Planctomycetota bacterium]
MLEDDLRFFPPYNAAPLVRQETLDAHPGLEAAIARLAFRIPDNTAQALNNLVESNGESLADTARAFLELEGLVEGQDPAAMAALEGLKAQIAPSAGARSLSPVTRPGFGALLVSRWRHLRRQIIEHLTLTLVAVLLATLVAIPLGIVITKHRWLRQLVLGIAGILQTVPSLALLAFMIPLLGLNVFAAIAALFLYALLPILRNTYTGIVEVDPELVEAAEGMGLRPQQVLFRIQLPLAARTIMAGIRTSTVICVGVATLAAFIGSGGLGEPIVEGLYLNDVPLILTGALPAAALALLCDLLVGWAERSLQTGNK